MHDIEWDNDMFRKGDKPTVLIDYPIHVMDYEVIDIFNWQDKANQMYSQISYCQHDAFLPIRVKGRNTGKPQWGKLEILEDGEWVDYEP